MIGLCSFLRCGFAAFLLCVAVFPASAQQYVKCVHSKTKEIWFRAAPCPATSAEWDQVQVVGAGNRSAGGYGNPYDRSAMSRAEADARIEADRQHMRRSAGGRTYQQQPQGARIPAQHSRDYAACEAAKQHRKSVLDAVGLGRTHDLLRSLDDQVNRACK